MIQSVIFEDQLEIPLSLTNLSDFRRWALSDDFPDRGRIDYIAGKIEVDMTPENLFAHGTLKTEFAAALLRRAKELRLGHVFVDSTRISSAAALPRRNPCR